MRRLTLTVLPQQDGSRVETLLRHWLGLSAASVRNAKQIPDGILLDNYPVFTTAKVSAGQMLSVAIGDTQSSEFTPPQSGSVPILFEDEDILIINKPGGMPVHPGQGHHGDTVADYLGEYYRKIGLTAAFHPVNRLDSGTSGLMAVAKHAYAHHRLQDRLHTGSFQREYLAVAEGILPAEKGRIDVPIARQPGSVIKRQTDPAGARAITHYEVLETGAGRSLVKLVLETGRTHQIRVHLASLGCPIAGDFLYGSELSELPNRFALHASAIELEHPVTGERIQYSQPLPQELYRLLESEEEPHVNN